jgi:hypothetical protein
MATAAIGIFAVMIGHKPDCRVALQTLRPVEDDFSLRRYSAMGVMASDARQIVTARLLALAQRERLHLRDRAEAGLGGAGMNEMRGVVC